MVFPPSGVRWERGSELSDHREAYRDLCAAYAVGALEGSDLKDLVEHLESGCTVCAEDLASYHSLISLLLLALPKAAVPSELKDRVLFAARMAQVTKARFHQTDQDETQLESPPRGAGWIRRHWLSISASVIVVLAGVAGYFFLEPYLADLSDQSAYIRTQRLRIDQLRIQHSKDEEILAVLRSGSFDAVKLAGQGLTAASSGMIVWNPSTSSAVLQVFNLPVAPPDSDYQVWLIANQAALSVGVFVIDAQKGLRNLYALQTAATVGSADSLEFSVTLEPKGGSAAPTGRVCLRGMSPPVR